MQPHCHPTIHIRGVELWVGLKQRDRCLGDKSFEWYAAFGLLVTIVWLYLEMLRLFSKLRQR